MGNCCGTSSNNEIQQRDYNIPLEKHEFLDHQEEQEQEQEDNESNPFDDDQISETTSTTTRGNTPFQATPLNEITTTSTTTMVLPLVDPRLVSLLDFFRHLSARRKDIFNKIMRVHRQDFESIFNEMKKVQQLEKQNSKMGGVIRQRSLSVGDSSGLKMERFKVKPIDSGGIKQPPKDNKDIKGGGGTKPTDSKK